jgi:hypothetical protein
VNKAENSDAVCGFCGKRRDEVSRMIAGSSANICDECVAFCIDALGSDTAAEVGGETTESPRDLRTEASSALSEYAVEKALEGQRGPALEKQVRILAAAALLHAGHFGIDGAAAFAGVSDAEFTRELQQLGAPPSGTIRPSRPPPAG